ncbi:tetratricopeptide repeat protein [Saccharibacillus sacchari]|uniref:Tetratricopeptide repeat protein n=1 Tax=Saccharibacillus sacchari TaxID=456493 RepID=A0ACC6PAS4_9BACL
MFGFGKKKEKKPQSSAESATAETVLTEERRAELLHAVSVKQAEAADRTGEAQASVQEELGLAFYELGQKEDAITALEASLQAKKSIGPGYKTLLKLYNQKRAEAAKHNDEASLQLYMQKMDGLMQISKDVTRGVK